MTKLITTLLFAFLCVNGGCATSSCSNSAAPETLRPLLPLETSEPIDASPRATIIIPISEDMCRALVHVKTDEYMGRTDILLGTLDTGAPDTWVGLGWRDTQSERYELIFMRRHIINHDWNVPWLRADALANNINDLRRVRIHLPLQRLNLHNDDDAAGDALDADNDTETVRIYLADRQMQRLASFDTISVKISGRHEHIYHVDGA